MVKILSVPENWLAKKGVKHPKLIVYGTAAVLSALAVYLTYRAISGAIARHRAAHPNPASVQEGLTNDLSNLDVTQATITEGNAYLIADNIFNAMNRYGTDDTAIIDNLSGLQTQGDLNLVIQKFGVKPYDGFGLATGWFETNVIATMKNMNGWLRAELSGDSLQQVKDIYAKLNVSF